MQLPSRQGRRQRRPRFVRQRRPRRRQHIRWTLVLVLAAIFLAAWVASSIRLGFCWADVTDLLHVHNRPRYTALACLGLVCVAIVAIARVLRGPKNDE